MIGESYTACTICALSQRRSMHNFRTLEESFHLRKYDLITIKCEELFKDQ